MQREQRKYYWKGVQAFLIFLTVLFFSDYRVYSSDFSAFLSNSNNLASEYNSQIADIIKNSQQNNHAQSNDLPCNEIMEEGIIYYAFSMSMNPDTIRNNIDIMNREKIKTVFVLRGLVDNNVIETKKKIEEILAGREAYVLIDPRIYRELEIKSVPYLAINKSGRIYKANGDITIDFFLEKIEQAERSDLGTIAQTYEITEVNMIDEMKKRMSNFNIESKLEKAFDKYINNLPRYKIGKFEKDTKYYVDPTVMVKSDIKDETGKVLIPAGSTYNPFDYIDFKRTGIIFDGSDKKQVEFVKKYIKEHSDDPFIDLITFNANPLEVSKEVGRYTFYLQKTMINSFRISNAPLVIKREGDLLALQGVSVYGGE